MRRIDVRRSTAELGRRALGRWVNVAQQSPFLIVVVALLLTGVGLTYTVATLAINTNTVDMLSEDVPFRRHDAAFKRAFPQFEDTIVAVLDGPTPERVDEAAERLAAGLGARGELFRDVYLPGGEPFFERHGLLFLDTDGLADLGDRLAAAQPLLAALADDPSLRGFVDVLDLALGEAGPVESEALARLLDETAAVAAAAALGRPLDLSWRRLIGAIGPDAAAGDPMRFVVVQPELDYGSLQPAALPIAEIRRQAAALAIDAGHGLRLRLTGPAVLDHEELESVRLGGQTAALLSLALVTLLLVVGLRSARLVLATVATLLMGLVWTATFATLAIGHLNLLSVAFAVLFVGLGVDFGIHTSLRYREEAAASGADRAAALRRAALGVGGALTLSALSAAAGFYAFLPTEYRGLAELGLISGTGMFIALATSLTVLPALIALSPPRVAAAPAAPRASALATLVRRRGRPVLALSVLLGLAGLAALPFVRFDVDPINLMDPDTESVATFRDLARDPETSPYTLDVLAPDLAEAERLADRLAALPEVARATTLADFVPADQDGKLAIIDEVALFLGPVLGSGAAAPPPDAAARAAAFDRLRARLAAVADGTGPLAPPAGRLLTALEEFVNRTGLSGAALADLEGRLMAHLPRTLERLDAALSAGPVAPDDLPPGLRGRWLAADGRARVEVYPAGDMADQGELTRFADTVLAAAPTATGAPVIAIEAGRAVVTAFVQATVLALLLIVSLLLAVLRRPTDMALVLAPLGLAALMTAGASVLLGLPFNFANIIVLPLILGLGVSAGIHFVLRRREDADGGGVLATSTPRAVLFSSLTTVASFGSLVLSGHRGMTSMGQLLTLGIGFTLLATMVVLPSLMAEIGARRAADGEPARL